MANTKQKQQVSDFFMERLAAWGIRRIFGLPGDGINGLLGAMQRAGDQFEFVQVAHEEVAALAACGHAKFTGEIGVCMATSGPGVIHMLNGLYDAKMDGQPVLAIVGQQDATALGSEFQQEVNIVSLVHDVASAYHQLIIDPAQVRHVVDRAVRIALAERTVTCVVIPHDVQQKPAEPSPPREHGTMHSSVGFTRPRVLPHDEDLRRAADVLNAGKRLAVLVGAGALHATDEVIRVAEATGAGVAKALLGKAALPDDLPFVTGTVGWLGTKASDQMMEECDTLLMVGTSFPYTEFLPKEGQARAVQIDWDARRMGLRYPTQVNLVGDAAETLRALLPLLRSRAGGEWHLRVQSLIAESRSELEEHAHVEASPLNPQLVFWELNKRLPSNTILTGDCGTSTVWYARYLDIQRGMMASLSGTLATMGSAVPYAISAKFAHPDRPVVALIGDGAMQMLGNTALITVAKYWRRWRDPRVIIVVANNRDLSYVSWEQRVIDGFAKFPATQDLLDFPFARGAELLGLRGLRVESPDAVGPALDEAFASDRPVVIDAVVDANVPPLPPTLRDKQRKKLEQALADGDPDVEAVEEQLVTRGFGST